MTDDVAEPAAAPQSQFPSPGFLAITVMVHEDGTITYDLGGITAWAAYSLLYAITNELWDALPAPTPEKRA